MNNIVVAAVGTCMGMGTFYYSLYKNLFEKSAPDPVTPLTLVDPSQQYALLLINKEVLTHDTIRLTFRLPSERHVLGLPTGKHIYISATINGELVIRTYTPTTLVNTQGYMTIVLKVYKAGVHPNFPHGGKMSQYLDSISIGTKVDVKGPMGKITYHGEGKFEIIKKFKFAKHVGLIAGGTGITPMYQLIMSVLRNVNDYTNLSLIFSNHSEDDILLKDELDREICSQFDVWYTVSKNTNPNWPYGKGRIDEAMILNHLPQPDSNTLIAICGPPAMVTHTCGLLNNLNFTADMIIRY